MDLKVILWVDHSPVTIEEILGKDNPIIELGAHLGEKSSKRKLRGRDGIIKHEEGESVKDSVASHVEMPLDLGTGGIQRWKSET
jgi:hypothetical protein